MPNYSLKARMLRIKQTDGLNFATALPTSPRRLPILPLCPFFMEFRGPSPTDREVRPTGFQALPQPFLQVLRNERVVVQVRVGLADPVDLLHLAGGQVLARVQTPAALQ